jgi:hypothetical protein
MRVSVPSADSYVCLIAEGSADDLEQPRCDLRPFWLVLISAPQTASNHRVLQNYGSVSSNEPKLFRPQDPTWQ